MNVISKILAGIVGGLMFAFLGYMVVVLPMPAGMADGAAGAVMWGLWAIAIAITYFAATAGKAWRRLLLSCAIFALMIPLSTFVMSSAQVSGMGGEGAAGAAIGGGVVTAMTGFVSIFLAAIFLIIGLLVGKDRPVTQ